MAEKQQRRQTFMARVFYILVSQVLIKLLGMVYRLVITNIPGFGNVGNGFYNAGYQVYTLLLAISSVGIPNAISKMVSERTALGKYDEAKHVFHTALWLFAGIGLFFSAVLFFGADFIAHNVIHMDGVEYTLRALSPAIFFVCTGSVVRGYCLGNQDVRASGRSQVIEQIFKTSLTIVIVYMLISREPQIMAAGANLATALATMLSFGYIVFYYFRHRSRILQRGPDSPEPVEYTHKIGFFTLSKSILFISIPISLSSIITAFARVIDTSTIMTGIKSGFASGIPGTPGVPTPEMLNLEATRLSGMLSKSDIITNLPLALNIAFATVLVPTISAALARGEREDAESRIRYSLLISTLLILPCAVGLITLAQPIFHLIYPVTPDGADLLQLAAVALIFTALDQTICGALHGLGKLFIPAIGLFCGMVVKILLNIVLIRIPSVNIYGAAISSIFCHLTAFLICYFSLKRSMLIRIPVGKYLIKPVAASAIMGVFSIAAFRAVHALLHSNAIAVFASIALSVIVYVLALCLLRILTPDEIKQLPGGTKILSILQKCRLVRE